MPMPTADYTPTMVTYFLSSPGLDITMTMTVQSEAAGTAAEAAAAAAHASLETSEPNTTWLLLRRYDGVKGIEDITPS